MSPGPRFMAFEALCEVFLCFCLRRSRLRSAFQGRRLAWSLRTFPLPTSFARLTLRAFTSFLLDRATVAPATTFLVSIGVFFLPGLDLNHFALLPRVSLLQVIVVQFFAKASLRIQARSGSCVSSS